MKEKYNSSNIEETVDKLKILKNIINYKRVEKSHSTNDKSIEKYENKPLTRTRIKAEKISSRLRR